ncbi:hypothetical protein PV328_001830 [Microctonus aethiopoides]|uniref:Uncharacterized protein n=1 Tax=Microctonus aethiopoides TaxID=144406 RepID=A0AA39KY02_9HYME|nr:hypothetical protein PV328_001830 [Microctonus aethiopoides]
MCARHFRFMREPSRRIRCITRIGIPELRILRALFRRQKHQKNITPGSEKAPSPVYGNEKSDVYHWIRIDNDRWFSGFVQVSRSLASLRIEGVEPEDKWKGLTDERQIYEQTNVVDNRECCAFSDNGQVHVPEAESVPPTDNYCVVTELRGTLRLPRR